MKEPYGEGVASHTGPESCAGRRKAVGEAMTGEHAGRPSGFEITSTGMPTPQNGGEGHTHGDVNRELPVDPAESKNLRMRGRSMHGNREIPSLLAEDGTANRPEKAMSHKSDMHGGGKSDSRRVPKNRSNKGQGRPAETEEGRRLAKGNSQRHEKGVRMEWHCRGFPR